MLHWVRCAESGSLASASKRAWHEWAPPLLGGFKRHLEVAGALLCSLSCSEQPEAPIFSLLPLRLEELPPLSALACRLRLL